MDASSEALAQAETAGMRSRWEIRQLASRTLARVAELSVEKDADDADGGWLAVLTVATVCGALLTGLLLGAGAVVWTFWEPTVQSVLQGLGVV
jgi:hypothetical protein